MIYSSPQTFATEITIFHFILDHDGPKHHVMTICICDDINDLSIFDDSCTPVAADGGLSARSQQKLQV